MSSADLAKWLDGRVFGSRIGDAMLIGSTRIEGAFFDVPRDLELPNGSIRALALSFDCHYDASIGRLSAGDLVQIEGRGRYRFMSEVIPGGDHSGKTTVELGTLK
jgi:hypothetical protein